MERSEERWSGRRRLRAVARLVPPGSRVADIGSDHGLLPRSLLFSGRAAFCIASDIDRTSLSGFLRPGHPLATRLELRWGDGLSVLRPEDRVDVLILTGLGARAICRILSHDRRSRIGLRRLVLQPQAEPARLRRWLAQHGYAIVDETLAAERRRWYVTIAAEPTPDPVPRHPRLSTDDLYESGPCLVRSADPEVAACWRQRLVRWERILHRARGGPGRERAQAERERARRVLAVLTSLV